MLMVILTMITKRTIFGRSFAIFIIAWLLGCGG
jgi:hypothetical protein